MAILTLSKMTKAMLQRRCRELARDRDDLARQLYSITPSTVAYTAETDIRRGTTVMVRVPKPFRTR